MLLPLRARRRALPLRRHAHDRLQWACSHRPRRLPPALTRRCRCTPLPPLPHLHPNLSVCLSSFFASYGASCTHWFARSLACSFPPSSIFPPIACLCPSSLCLLSSTSMFHQLFSSHSFALFFSAGVFVRFLLFSLFPKPAFPGAGAGAMCAPAVALSLSSSAPVLPRRAPSDRELAPSLSIANTNQHIHQLLNNLFRHHMTMAMDCPEQHAHAQLRSITSSPRIFQACCSCK